MDKQLLIKFNKNYADEFDIEGFVVMTEIKWEEHKNYAKKHFDKKRNSPLLDSNELPNSYRNRKRFRTYVYFGTNEYITYNDYDDYIRSFDVIELDGNQYQVLNDLFELRDTIRNGTLVMLDEAYMD